MKILILANKDSGLLSFREEVVSAFVSAGNDVVVSIPKGDRISEIESLGCRVVITNFERKGTNPINDLKLLNRYLSILSKERPDVVLTYTIKPNIYGGIACRIKKIPYIVNITGLGTSVENPGILQKLTTTLYKIAMKRAKCIFFQNEGNRLFFEKRHINKKAHHLIPGSGVNLSKFTPMIYPKHNKIVFLFISRIMKEKGIEEYLAAAKFFTAKRKDVEFHILGSCEEKYFDELTLLDRKGVVKYYGGQKDVRPYIAEADCLVHPTFYPEGMSNVVLEASASARPVITTRRHGCMEAVEDGVTGYLFPERDTAALIATIERFLALPAEARAEMGKKARQKMEREFDRQIVIDAYLSEVEKSYNKQYLSMDSSQFEQRFKDMCALVNDKYTIVVNYHINEEKEIILSDGDDPIKCRFCGRSEPEVSFEQVTHAISHMVENRHLKSDYECDVCNSIFAKYESDYSAYMNLYHTVFRIHGKRGIPKYKNNSNTFSKIQTDGNNLHIQIKEDEESLISWEDADKEKNTIRIKGKRTYVPQDVLRALVKMALSIMPKQNMPDFEMTLDWLLKRKDKTVSGVVYPATFRFYKTRLPFTSCFIFKKKNSSSVPLPEYIFVLAYANIVVQVPLPFVKDDNQFKDLKGSMPVFPTPLDEVNIPFKTFVADLKGTAKIYGEEVSISLAYKDVEENILPTDSDKPEHK